MRKPKYYLLNFLIVQAGTENFICHPMLLPVLSDTNNN